MSVVRNRGLKGERGKVKKVNGDGQIEHQSSLHVYKCAQGDQLEMRTGFPRTVDEDDASWRGCERQLECACE